MNSGIYRIIVGSKTYYGRTTNFSKRRSKHKCTLEKGTHGNPILQKAYNKYHQFKFEVLEEITEVVLQIEREQWYIDNTINCNLKSAVDGKLPGEGKGLPGKPCSEETKAKIRKAKLGTVPWNKGIKTGATHRIGTKHTEETKIKIGEKLRGRKAWNKGTSKVYLWEKDGWRFECSAVDLCNNFNLDDGSLCRITNGKRKTYRGFKCIACIIRTLKVSNENKNL